MIEFFQAALNHTFILNALIMGGLAGIACGVVGTYVVARRITYIAGSIAHCVLGGMGLARYLEVVWGWSFIHPMQGAIVAALASAITIGWVNLHAKEREDTVIGAIWAIGMAVGIVFIAKTPGYNENLMSYLFGNILMVSGDDLLLVGFLDIVILATTIAFYNKLQLVCFDDEFARVKGVNVDFFYMLLLCLTGLTVVILVDVVGIIMVIALITLPAAIAAFFAKKIWQIMIIAAILSIFFTTLGLGVSFGPDLPAGSVIILLAGISYIGLIALRQIKRARR